MPITKWYFGPQTVFWSRARESRKRSGGSAAQATHSYDSDCHMASHSSDCD